MEVQRVIFILFSGGCFVAIIFLLVTKRGHNAFVRIFLGAIEEDYGDIGDTRVNGVKQSLRLLRCTRRGNSFFVLESRILATTQYVKLSYDLARRLAGLLSGQNRI